MVYNDRSFSTRVKAKLRCDNPHSLYPPFVVEMTNKSEAVVGCVFAHNRTTFYATDIIELYSVFACPISCLHAAATAPAVTINIYKQYFYANNPL